MFKKFYQISGSGSALMEQEYRIETADTMDYTVAGPLARR